MNTHAILYCLVKPLNCVVYEHILIKRVTEEVERMLTAVNINRVFTQSLTLILFCFIETARTSLLNILTWWGCTYWLSLTANTRWLNASLRVQLIFNNEFHKFNESLKDLSKQKLNKSVSNHLLTKYKVYLNLIALVQITDVIIEDINVF